MNSRYKRKLLIIELTFITSMFLVGYAILSSNLNIVGTATISSANVLGMSCLLI